MDAIQRVYDLVAFVYRRHKLMRRNSESCDVLLERVVSVERTLQIVVARSAESELLQDEALQPILVRIGLSLKKAAALIEEIGEMGPLDRAWGADRLSDELESVAKGLSDAQGDLMIPLQVTNAAMIRHDVQNVGQLIRSEFLRLSSTLTYDRSSVSSSMSPRRSVRVDPENVWERLRMLNDTKFSFIPFFVDKDVVGVSLRKFEDRFTPIAVTSMGASSTQSSERSSSSSREIMEFENIDSAWEETIGGGCTNVLIEAPAGSGKSTLVRWIARNADKMRCRRLYSELTTVEDITNGNEPCDKELEWCAGVCVVDLVKVERYLEEGGGASLPDVCTLSSLLQTPCFQSGGGFPLFSPQEIDSAIETLTEMKRRVLYVFDGYDEVQHTKCTQLRQLLLALHTLLCGSAVASPLQSFAENVIVTSRPERLGSFSLNTASEEVVEFRDFAVLRLMPWSAAACELYVDRFPCLSTRAKDAAKEMLLSQYFDALERLPFAVHLVCCALLTEESQAGAAAPSPSSQGIDGEAPALLKCPSHMFEMLVEKTLSKKSDELCVQNSKWNAAMRSELQRLAFVAVSQWQTTVTIPSLDHATLLARSGLVELIQAPRHFRFLHKSLMEYLAACHVFQLACLKDMEPIRTLPLHQSVVLFFIADLMRSQQEGSSGSIKRSISTAADELGNAVANRFLKECIPTVARCDMQLLERSRQSRKQAAEKAGIPGVLQFFLVAAVRPPPDSRDRNDLDGTRRSMKVLLDRLPGSTKARFMQALPAATRRAVAPSWSVLFVEPAAKLGAIYVLNRLCNHHGHVPWMKEAALEAATSRRSRATLDFLMRFHGVRLSIDEAVNAHHIETLTLLMEQLNVALSRASLTSEQQVSELGAQAINLHSDVQALLPRCGWWKLAAKLSQAFMDDAACSPQPTDVGSRIRHAQHTITTMFRIMMLHLLSFDCWESERMEILSAPQLFGALASHCDLEELLRTSSALVHRKRVTFEEFLLLEGIVSSPTLVTVAGKIEDAKGSTSASIRWTLTQQYFSRMPSIREIVIDDTTLLARQFGCDVGSMIDVLKNSDQCVAASAGVARYTIVTEAMDAFVAAVERHGELTQKKNRKFSLRSLSTRHLGLEAQCMSLPAAVCPLVTEVYGCLPFDVAAMMRSAAAAGNRQPLRAVSFSGAPEGTTIAAVDLCRGSSALSTVTALDISDSILTVDTQGGLACLEGHILSPGEVMTHLEALNMVNARGTTVLPTSIAAILKNSGKLVELRLGQHGHEAVASTQHSLTKAFNIAVELSKSLQVPLALQLRTLFVTSTLLAPGTRLSMHVPLLSTLHLSLAHIPDKSSLSSTANFAAADVSTLIKDCHGLVRFFLRNDDLKATLALGEMALQSCNYPFEELGLHRVTVTTFDCMVGFPCLRRLKALWLSDIVGYSNMKLLMMVHSCALMERISIGPGASGITRWVFDQLRQARRHSNTQLKFIHFDASTLQLTSAHEITDDGASGSSSSASTPRGTDWRNADVIGVMGQYGIQILNGPFWPPLLFPVTYMK